MQRGVYDSITSGVSAALDETLLMHPFKGAPPGDCVYIGLWSSWTIGGEAPAAKVLLATVPTAHAAKYTAGKPVPLGELAWQILQFQIVRQTDKVPDPSGQGTLWEGIKKILAADFKKLEDTEDNNQCAKRIFFDAHAEVHATRSIKNRDWFTQAVIQRIDSKPGEQTAKPMGTLSRAIVEYNVRRLPMTEVSSGVQMRVYIERNTPKNSTLGQLIHRESGFIKESNLLAALEEWRTWFVLDSNACNS